MNNSILLVVLFILLCFIVAFLIVIKICNKRNDEIIQLKLNIDELKNVRIEELKSYFKERWDKEESNLRVKRLEANTAFEKDKWTFDQQLEKLQAVLKEKEKRYEEVNQDLELYKKGKIEEIDSSAAEYEQHKHILISNSIDKYRDKLIEQANEVVGKLTLEINNMNNELKEVENKLEEERRRRAVINEEIRRQREVEEQQDFYRIKFSEEDKNDVEILRSIAPRLRHPEAINKVIWSAYYQKPLAELRKRVAIEGSGIYKITRIKTGEIYIGQARNVSTRWTDHCKAALGVGTLASSQLHRVMREDGCENFLFELLEETPIDKLKERESYYIDFYDSKNYGLNTIRGEQK